MSKQSRARAKRHHKKVGTGAAAPTIIRRVQRMSDTNRYITVQKMLDELHRELCKKQSTWGSETINLFYCELWNELASEISTQRQSKSKERTLQLIVDIKVCKSIL